MREYNLNQRSCEFCDKVLSTAQNKKQHIETCNVKKLREEQSIQKAHIENILARLNALEEEKRTTQITNNFTNNIVLLPYGSNNISLSAEDVIKLFQKGFKTVPDIIKYIHFNTDHPENHNIYISSIQADHLTIYNGRKWVIVEKDETLGNMHYDTVDVIIKKFDEHGDKMSTLAIKNWGDFSPLKTKMLRLQGLKRI